MCAIDVPKDTLDTLTGQQRAFIWTGDKHYNGSQWKVAWDMVTRPKDKGGLGIKDLRIQNQCLLGKIMDKLLRSPTTSWQAWFHRMYGQGADRNIGDPHHLDTPTWRCLLDGLPALRKATTMNIGDGEMTSFWLDHWIGAALLATMFLALFSHSERRNISVAAAMIQSAWEQNLAPRLSEATTGERHLLSAALQGMTLTPGISDQRLLMGDNKAFTAKGAYRLHYNHLLVDTHANCA